MNYIKPCTRKNNAIHNLVTLSLPPRSPKQNLHVDASIIKTGFDPNTCRSNFQVKTFLQRGDLNGARKLFDEMPHKNTISTNIMIMGYIKSGNLSEARSLFNTMIERTAVTWTMLIGGYAQNNRFREAFSLFAEMHRHGTDPDHVTLATLLSGFTEFDSVNEVAQDLGFMPTEFTFAAVLTAGIQLDDIEFGQQVHGLVVKSNFVWNVFVANALLDFYSKHNRVADARKLFDEMPELDGISYNVLITCYAWNGRHEESLELFRELQFTRFDRRQFPFATLLSTAANASNLEMGRQIHSQTIVTAAISEILVGNSLVDMYAKCDKFGEANRIFADLAHQSSVPWTALISAYVQTGLHEDGLKLFIEMQRAKIGAEAATYASIGP
ncbi:Tetratricopeptide-like helical domain superfamily [Sesbania bispinosa]|nr:Tetratricopeptide-like helical domain superfamily [Sesbania bispinosa]